MSSAGSASRSRRGLRGRVRDLGIGDGPTPQRVVDGDDGAGSETFGEMVEVERVPLLVVVDDVPVQICRQPR
jgi:hypothetical protein